MSVEETVKRLLKNKIARDYVKDYAKRNSISLPLPKKITEVSDEYVGKKVLVTGGYDSEGFNNDIGTIILVDEQDSPLYGVEFENPELHMELHDLNGELCDCSGYYIRPNDNLTIELYE